MKTLDRYRMTVYYFHALPDEYVSQKRQSSVYRRKGALIVEGELGYVICFQSIGEVSNTFPLTISVCDYNHFVSSFHETLRKLVLVNFCSPKIRVEHVAHHRNHMSPLFPLLHIFFIYSFSCFIKLNLNHSKSKPHFHPESSFLSEHDENMKKKSETYMSKREARSISQELF